MPLRLRDKFVPSPRSAPGASPVFLPQNAALVDERGFVTRAWWPWFQQILDALIDLMQNSGGAPEPHAPTHEPGGSDPMTVDAAAATGSLRTLGTGPLQAAPGNDPRFTAASTPLAHHVTHEPGGSDQLVNAAWTNLSNTFTADQVINRPGTSSSAPLQIYGTSDATSAIVAGFYSNVSGRESAIAFSDGYTYNVGIGMDAQGAFNVWPGRYPTVAGTSMLRLTQGGVLNVNGVGTHSFSAGGTGGNHLAVRNTQAGASNYAALLLGNDVSSARGAIYSLASTYGSGGYNMADGITVEANGGGGLSLAAPDLSGGGNIRFYAGGTAERMRIDYAGTVMVGTGPDNFPYAPGRLTVASDFTSYYGLVIQNRAADNTGYFQVFLNNAGAGAGAIMQTGTGSVSFLTTSDQRLKRDCGVATDVSGLRAVAIHDFEWLADDRPDRGLFAQETHPVFPRAVCVGSDDLSTPWMTDYSKFVPDLIVGWQQHEARLARLEERL